MPEPHRNMLEVVGLTTGYGRVEVLRDVSIEVGEGEVVTLIGANGAGKSTLLKSVVGLLPAVGGLDSITGEEIGGRSGREARAAGARARSRGAHALRRHVRPGEPRAWGVRVRAARQPAADRGA